MHAACGLACGTIARCSPSPSAEFDVLTDVGVQAEGGAKLIWVDPPSGVQRTLHTTQSQALGGGAYGYCFPVQDEHTAEKLCAKFARDSADIRELARSSLRKEFAALSRFQRPNIVKACGLCLACDGAIGAMILPLAERSLQAWVHDNGPLAPTDVDGVAELTSWPERSCLLQCIRGIAHMHDRQVVHLDLKPPNVLVSGPQGKPTCQLADFGKRRCLEAADGIPDEVLRANWINSDEYRPLELHKMQGMAVSPRKRYDLWAFGCIVYEVAASTHPRARGKGGAMGLLFQGLGMKGSGDVAIGARDRKLKVYCPRTARPVIRMCQPRSVEKFQQTTAVAAHNCLHGMATK